MIIAFPLQQWLHERASLLRYTYIACLVFFILGLFNDELKLLRYFTFLTPEGLDRLWGPRSAGFLSRVYSGRGMKLITHLCLVPMSRMSGATPLLPTCFHGPHKWNFTFGRACVFTAPNHPQCILAVIKLFIVIVVYRYYRKLRACYYDSCFGHPSDFIDLFSNIAYCWSWLSTDIRYHLAISCYNWCDYQLL
jgi:hypothetical protein